MSYPMLRYGEIEAAAIADLYASLPAEEFVQEMVTGLNLAFMRGAADAFRAIGEAADRKVETILAKDPNEIEDQSVVSTIAGGLLAFEAVTKECIRQYRTLQDLIVSKLAEVEAMDEEPRVNAQVEGADTIPGAEAAR